MFDSTTRDQFIIAFMKTLLAAALFLASQALWAQTATPGTITTGKTVTAKAGAITCTFTYQEAPVTPVGVLVSCVGPIGTYSGGGLPATGNTSGITGALNEGADAATWTITQPVTGTVNWQIAVNGVTQNGTF